TVLGAADAVAVPSTRPDPLPNAALEAAAAGLPIVASRLGGLPEIVRDGETGLLVDPGDPVALAAGLRKLADDPAAAHSLGAAGAADVRARFALPTMLAALQEHYDRLLAQPAPSSASRGRAREPETE
ncbi:MAG: glycosyltransferase family 4 protein, partial [Thermoleophilaceae bacterium]|nr:glycosyltransferase family 4 protein [Thermoleophilaceae bacterium]